MGNLESMSNSSEAAKESKIPLEVGVVEMETTYGNDDRIIYLNPKNFPRAKFVSLDEDHDNIDECAKLYPLKHDSSVSEKVISIDYNIKRSHNIVTVTPYAIDTPLDTAIFEVDFAYNCDKTSYAKKILEINTEELFKATFNLIKDKDLFSKVILKLIHFNIKISLKSVVLLDAEKNHLRIAKVNKDTKILFRCSERLIHLTGSRIDTSRKQANKLCTKEDFMAIKKQIGGLDDVIDQIYSSLILTRLNHEKSEELGLKLNLGAVFVGPPGTGKSALASLIADTLNGKLTFVKGPELKGSYVGETEKAIRKLFEDAEQNYETYGASAPYHIIVIDEIDSVAPKRKQTMDGHDNSMTNQFLACTSVKVPPNLLLFGTTNMLHLVDDAMLREGRLGIHVTFKLPDRSQREAIIHIYLDKITNYLAENVDIQHLVDISHGLTGAEIEASINEAKQALLENSELTTIDHSVFVSSFTKRRMAKHFCDYIVWHDDIKNFINDVKKAFSRDLTSSVNLWRLHGNGLITLAKHISNLLNIEMHFFDRNTELNLFKNQNGFLITRSNAAYLQIALKMFSHKYIVFEISSDAKNADFVMPMVHSKKQLISIFKTLNNYKLDDFEDIDSIKYPFPFSRLFELKKGKCLDDSFDATTKPANKRKLSSIDGWIQ